MKLGYKLSSEEHGPNQLIQYAQKAENSGFEFALLSDHYHPWTQQQGESPFVWNTLGGLAQATEQLDVVTGVTCPTFRIHPSIIAQSAATTAAMMSGRFSLGVGTGERLNEHILGHYWPPHEIRAEMLEEAINLIRELWKGEKTTYYGRYFEVNNARIFTLPEELPPIHIAASGPRAAKLAGRAGDGLVSTAPKEDIVELFEDRGDGGRPKYAEITVCYADSEDDALETARKWWPNGALKGELGQELSVPAHFEQAAQMVEDKDIRESYVLGSDPQSFVEMIEEYRDAGFDHICLHQVGPEQEEFIEFARENLVEQFNGGV